MKEDSTQSQYTILAVDDQELNLAILEDYLVPLGYRVIKARNGREALAQIESARPDLVLLDIMMPEIDGYEVCRRVKENPESRDIPVVMVTSLEGTEDMVKALESGADEFLTKPVNDIEIRARVKSLLKKKTLNDQLKSAYSHINNLTLFAENKLAELSSETFSGEEANKHLIERLLRISVDDTTSPTHILLGKGTGEYMAKGRLYSYEDGRAKMRRVSGRAEGILGYAEKYPDQEIGLTECNSRICRGDECNTYLGEDITNQIGVINNFIICNSKKADSLVAAFNYGKEVTPNDADTLRSFLLLYNVFTTISGQMDEIDGAFKYLVTALARAAEANDEETGNHIVRVNEYSKILAEEMKMPSDFTRDIGFFAQMHDVGKIHIHISLLRKPGGLTDEEAKMVRDHTVYGSMILGEEPRLKMARDIALCHQERYDGSGYPRGLKGDEIPISGRIVALADVYDALRSKRSYKPAFPHKRSVEIITKGDVRTLPQHFDPKVLEAFIKREKEFESIYQSLTDENHAPS
ncbi:MAG: response regulator receiver modulated metal dependent phosphohydrolase [Deltaproteobacteria bacterium]|nr:response regulator receiver modulated metal dependent phosphohydrolase [Deltaproteobacteria bacterium]